MAKGPLGRSHAVSFTVAVLIGRAQFVGHAKGIVHRMETGGHIVSPLSFTNSHTKSRENLRLLSDVYGDKITLQIYDNSVPGGPMISIEELERKEQANHERLKENANFYLEATRRRLVEQGGSGSVHGSGQRSGEESRQEVSFASSEFDPKKFQTRVGAVAELAKTYVDSGVGEFKTLATRMAARFPDKFGNMKPYLRAVWNAVAEQMDLEEVTKKEAEAIYAEAEKATASPAGASWKDAAGKERKIPGYSPPDAVSVQNGSRVVIKAKDGSIHVGVVKGMDDETVTISTYSEEDGEGERAFPKSAIVGVRDADGMNASRRRGASSHEPLHTSIMRDAYTFKRVDEDGIGRVFGVDRKRNPVFVIYRKDENSDDGYVIMKTIRQNSKNRKVIDFYEREISRGVRSDEDGAGLVGQADRNENESANRRGGNGNPRRGRATPGNAGLAEGESASKGNADDRKGDGAESEPRIDIRSWHGVTVSNGMKDNDGRIFDLFNHLNRNADSQRIADKVFAIARKLGFMLGWTWC